MRKLTLPALVWVLCWLPHYAHADYIFAFDQSNYEVLPGETVDVRVSLEQIDNDPIDLTVDGINGPSVRVFFDSSDATQTAVVASEDDMFWNTEFAAGTPFGLERVVDAGSAGIQYFHDDFSGKVRGTSVFFGTFTFTAGDTPGLVTNLRADDFAGGTTANVLAGDDDFTVLDAFINPGFATITVIPEPTSLALLGLGVAAVCNRRK